MKATALALLLFIPALYASPVQDEPRGTGGRVAGSAASYDAVLWPPASFAPPMITAAIASSSYPVPRFGSAVCA